MDIIVRGSSSEIDFVRRICREKVRRGLITILPATNVAIADTTGSDDITAPADSKYIDDGDLHEVDLDADDKTLSENDTKDVPSDDAQEKSTAKKTPRRSKKTE